MIKNKKISDSAGFTFAELMIVMGIIGVLAAIGLPSFLRGLPEKRLKHATRNLYADFQKVRLLAVKENRTIAITFDTAGKKYSYPVGDGVKEVDLVNLYGDVDYGCSDTSLGTPINISFDSLGTAKDSSGTTIVGDPQTPVYFQSMNDTTVCYAVTVSPLGVAKVLRYSDSVWK